MKTLLLLVVGLSNLLSSPQPLEHSLNTFSTKRVETFSAKPDILLMEISDNAIQYYFLVSLDQEGNVIKYVEVGMDGGEDTVGSFTYDYDPTFSTFTAMQQILGSKGHTTLIRQYDVSVTSFPLLFESKI